MVFCFYHSVLVFWWHVQSKDGLMANVHMKQSHNHGIPTRFSWNSKGQIWYPLRECGSFGTLSNDNPIEMGKNPTGISSFKHWSHRISPSNMVIEPMNQRIIWASNNLTSFKNQWQGSVLEEVMHDLSRVVCKIMSNLDTKTEIVYAHHCFQNSKHIWSYLVCFQMWQQLNKYAVCWILTVMKVKPKT